MPGAASLLAAAFKHCGLVLISLVETGRFAAREHTHVSQMPQKPREMCGAWGDFFRTLGPGDLASDLLAGGTYGTSYVPPLVRQPNPNDHLVATS